MSEKNTKNTATSSAVARIQRRSMLKKQRIAIVLMAVAIALLIVGLIAVNYLVQIYVFPDVDGTEYHIKKIDGVYSLCYKNGDMLDRNEEGYYLTDLGTQVKIDGETGQYTVYAVIDLEGTEEEGYAQRVLMFKQLTYDASSTKDSSRVIASIEIHNEYGSYTFKRAKDNNFEIVGYEGAPFNKETFARLAVACGYTISTLRLEEPKKLADGSIDYAEYGLVSETRTETETDEEGNETVVEYEYEPIRYVITTMTGEQHKVTLGDVTVTGNACYAKYEGRDTVYVLSSVNFEPTVFKSIEAYLTPTIVYPMGQTDYFNVYDFILRQDIDYDTIYAALEEKFGHIIDGDNAENIGQDDVIKYYVELLEKYSYKVCHFSYIDMDERKGSMYSYLPYESKLEYAGGYYINSSTIDSVLSALYATDFTEVIKLAPSDEELDRYGLDSAKYILSYYYKTEDDKGETIYVENTVKISEKTDEGIFYAYSDTYDMIVGVKESSFGFLEWDEIKWYDQSYIQLDLAYIESIKIEAPGYSVNFDVDATASSFMSYIEQSGSGFTDGKNTYKIEKDPKTGKYVLLLNGVGMDAINSGDFLITPIPYVKGTPQSDSFLFVEDKQVDTDEDGNDDAMAIYYYMLSYDINTKNAVLVEQVVIVDANGNKLGETGSWLKSYFETDYFVTNSGYVYITDKDSYIADQLDEKYGSVNRGSWNHGNVFVTQSGQYVLVNAKTGEWSILDRLEGGLYFADRNTSRLAQRAVEIPAKYSSSGKILRYPETYYPTTSNKLIYDESLGKIQAYNVSKKAYETATYSDCTIGIWNNGAYYLTGSGTLVVVNEESGDWGIIDLQTSENYVAEVYANDKLLDYNIKTTNHVGKLVDTSAIDNFKQFYSGMLYASLEGMAEISDEEMAALKSLDNFSSDTEGNPCQLKITIYGRDFKGNRRDTVYRFYQYTERKSYITIEAISEDDGFASDSASAFSKFYVLRTYADKIIEDAKKMANGEEIDAVTKY